MVLHSHISDFALNMHCPRKTHMLQGHTTTVLSWEISHSGTRPLTFPSVIHIPRAHIQRLETERLQGVKKFRSKHYHFSSGTKNWLWTLWSVCTVESERLLTIEGISPPPLPPPFHGCLTNAVRVRGFFTLWIILSACPLAAGLPWEEKFPKLFFLWSVNFCCWLYVTSSLSSWLHNQGTCRIGYDDQ